MPLYTIPLEVIELFGLIFFRVLGLMMTLPVFSSSTYSRYVRAGMVTTFAMAVTIGLKGEPHHLPATGGAFVLTAGIELFFGLAAGFVIRWVVEAALIGGQLIGFQMGFAIVNVVDPTTGSSVSLMATLQARLVLVVFLVGGLFRPFLEAIAHSYQLVPLGLVNFSGAHSEAYIDMMGQAFRMAVTLSGAPIVALMLSKVVLGIMARTVPQMNVFIVGFPLTIGIGFLMVGLMMPLFIRTVQGSLSQSLGQMLMFMQSAAP